LRPKFIGTLAGKSASGSGLSVRISARVARVRVRAASGGWYFIRESSATGVGVSMNNPPSKIVCLVHRYALPGGVKIVMAP
jgi:hypothetical protein